MSIYKNVRRVCAEVGTSVFALETKLGFARGSIYKWDKNIPGIDKVKAVVDELKKPIEYFLE